MKILKRLNDHYLSCSGAEEESLDLGHMNPKTIRSEAIQRNECVLLGLCGVSKNLDHILLLETLDMGG